MVQKPRRWNVVQHHTSGPYQIVEDFEGIQLIDDVLCRAKVGGQMVSVSEVQGHAVKIQVKRKNVLPLNIDSKVFISQRLPEADRKRPLAFRNNRLTTKGLPDFFQQRIVADYVGTDLLGAQLNYSALVTNPFFGMKFEHRLEINRPHSHCRNSRKTVPI